MVQLVQACPVPAEVDTSPGCRTCTPIRAQNPWMTRRMWMLSRCSLPMATMYCFMLHLCELLSTSCTSISVHGRMCTALTHSPALTCTLCRTGLPASRCWEQGCRVGIGGRAPWELSGSCCAPKPCELSAGCLHAPSKQRCCTYISYPAGLQMWQNVPTNVLINALC